MTDRDPNIIFTEIMQIEQIIDSPEAKGKLTTLKSYHRKLCKEYAKALAT